jgi:hypothetical protein
VVSSPLALIVSKHLRGKNLMRKLLFSAVFMTGLSAVTVVAQQTGAQQPLPSPNLAEDSRPSDYLRAAQAALAAGRTAEGASALEMAQTRMLDRSVPLGQTGNPSDNPTIIQITQARQALAAHDRAASLQAIQAAIATATAQGL